MSQPAAPGLQSAPHATPTPIRLILPATSANLGPGFDSVGLALGIALTIDAETSSAPDDLPLTIAATGRNPDRVSRLDRNMIFETYRELLTQAGRPVAPLALRIHNEIPIGMGCGSSAAALLGGVMLANHFGALGWDLNACIQEASRREGHPDNVAACALGGFTVSSVENGAVTTATFGHGLPWKLLLALPSASLPTEKARALLPAQYSRDVVVANLQRTALLVSAFALGRGDLLRVAMHDHLHQPYRMDACPLLPRLLPLAGTAGILSVTLSGAGPSVLLITEADADTALVSDLVRQWAGDPAPELLETSIGSGATQTLLTQLD